MSHSPRSTGLPILAKLPLNISNSRRRATVLPSMSPRVTDHRGRNPASDPDSRSSCACQAQASAAPFPWFPAPSSRPIADPPSIRCRRSPATIARVLVIGIRPEMPRRRRRVRGLRPVLRRPTATQRFQRGLFSCSPRSTACCRRRSFHRRNGLGRARAPRPLIRCHLQIGPEVFEFGSLGSRLYRPSRGMPSSRSRRRNLDRRRADPRQIAVPGEVPWVRASNSVRASM